jgi:hypothetical protein
MNIYIYIYNILVKIKSKFVGPNMNGKEDIKKREENDVGTWFWTSGNQVLGFGKAVFAHRKSCSRWKYSSLGDLDQSPTFAFWGETETLGLLDQT